MLQILSKRGTKIFFSSLLKSSVDSKIEASPKTCREISLRPVIEPWMYFETTRIRQSWNFFNFRRFSAALLLFRVQWRIQSAGKDGTANFRGSSRRGGRENNISASRVFTYSKMIQKHSRRKNDESGIRWKWKLYASKRAQIHPSHEITIVQFKRRQLEI